MTEGIGFLRGMSMIGVGIMLFLLPVAIIGALKGSTGGVLFLGLIVLYFWAK